MEIPALYGLVTSELLGTWWFEVLGWGQVVLLSGQKERAYKCRGTRALHPKPRENMRRKDGVNCTEPVKFTCDRGGFRAFSTPVRHRAGMAGKTIIMCGVLRLLKIAMRRL